MDGGREGKRKRGQEGEREMETETDRETDRDEQKGRDRQGQTERQRHVLGKGARNPSDFSSIADLFDTNLHF